MAVVLEEGRLLGLQAAIDSLAARKRERRESYLNQVTGELVEVDRTINVLRQDLEKALFFEKASVLSSPVRGRVQQVDVGTIGDVVQAGQQLMVVVPDGSNFEVEAMLINKDKAFVSEGHHARIKIDAFPFTRYGTIDGYVSMLSRNTIKYNENNIINNYTESRNTPLIYPIRISMEKISIMADGRDILFTPGMSVVAEIKTGDKSVIGFFLDPLLETADGAFREM